MKKAFPFSTLAGTSVYLDVLKTFLAAANSCSGFLYFGLLALVSSQFINSFVKPFLASV